MILAGGDEPLAGWNTGLGTLVGFGVVAKKGPINQLRETVPESELAYGFV